MSAALPIGYFGVDIGSSTVKLAVIDEQGEPLFLRYERHFSEVRATVERLGREALANLPGYSFIVSATGSGAMDLAKESGLDFVQEVTACAECLRKRLPECDVSIELGGEDAKIIFFSGGAELRMNEVCAGGTGAFLDHMAAMLNTDVAGLDELAEKYNVVYPIASRCGVFAKADILPLLNDGCTREDIAASIFHAVVEQTVSGLACGREIRGKVVFLGGPLAFTRFLKKRFQKVLRLEEDKAVLPQYAEYFVALGAAHMGMGRIDAKIVTTEDFAAFLDSLNTRGERLSESRLPPLFADAGQREDFFRRHKSERAIRASFGDCRGNVFVGFDMGSTTTKAVCVDEHGRILHEAYVSRQGSPLDTAIGILRDIYKKMPREAHIGAAAVTGYGSALVRAALNLDIDEVETVAHWTAARFFLPEVTYILDIGGQDIKCMHIHDGVIDRIQLNEACSSGCGSFVETFAASLGMSLSTFVSKALSASRPLDLGTRCTVFMNSRVKQAQKEGASVGDIAAGLSFSVIRNALYKVIKINNVDSLGPHVMAQGGAFLNNALLRALEICLGREVTRPDIAGLMGAFGAALIARARGPANGRASTIADRSALEEFRVDTRIGRCRNCPNNCRLTISNFADKRRFVAGNRCSRGAGAEKNKISEADNLSALKYRALFSGEYASGGNREFSGAGGVTVVKRRSALRGRIGIPRVLNVFENFPLWNALFTYLDFEVILSAESSRELYAMGCHTIPSQTLCYPAKLAHGHIMDLLSKDVNAIFYPCLPMERKAFADQHNHYNCPVVSGYPELVFNNIDLLRNSDIKFYCPFLPLEKRALLNQLKRIELFAGISSAELSAAVDAAFVAQDNFQRFMRQSGEKVLNKLKLSGKNGVILAGHPYHIDPEIHHGIADYIASLGVAVLTEDSVAHLAGPLELRVVDQWTYHSRLYRAAAVAAGTHNLALVHLVSFGCGLSALTAEQIEEILAAGGNFYTQIKIDEGHNIGPARIRIRSLLASMEYRRNRRAARAVPQAAHTKAVFTRDMRATHTILVPLLSADVSRLIHEACAGCGYKTAFLPDLPPEAVERGLGLVNNDVCYPAIITVGQLVHAVRHSGFDPDQVALLTYQSGGACRATNYYALLRKALHDAELGHIPVVSLNTGGFESSPGFEIDWQLMKRFFLGVCFADLLSRLKLRVAPYEVRRGQTEETAELWLDKGAEVVRAGRRGLYASVMRDMVRAFEAIPRVAGSRRARVAIVGEILVKYHNVANNNLIHTIEAEGGEAVLPDMMDFFLYCLYDDIFRRQNLGGSWQADIKSRVLRQLVDYCRAPFFTALKGSRIFEQPVPFDVLRKQAEGLVSFGHQAGEGWLLAAEMLKYLECGIKNIICVQPFGCLPNHITGKGIFRELKRRYPDANITAIDYDQGSSEANQRNRIRLLMDLAV